MIKTITTTVGILSQITGIVLAVVAAHTIAICDYTQGVLVLEAALVFLKTGSSIMEKIDPEKENDTSKKEVYFLKTGSSIMEKIDPEKENDTSKKEVYKLKDPG